MVVHAQVCAVYVRTRNEYRYTSTPVSACLCVCAPPPIYVAVHNVCVNARTPSLHMGFQQYRTDQTQRLYNPNKTYCPIGSAWAWHFVTEVPGRFARAREMACADLTNRLPQSAYSPFTWAVNLFKVGFFNLAHCHLFRLDAPWKGENLKSQEELWNQSESRLHNLRPAGGIAS